MSTAVKSKPKHTRSNRDGSWLPRAIGAVVVLVALVLFVAVFGSVYGEEFNPWTFQRQTYKFVQIPFLRIQVFPTKYKNRPLAAVTDIAPILGVTVVDPEFEEEDFSDDDSDEDTKQPLIVAAKPTKPNPAGRWDLVSSRRIASVPWYGDAKILCDLLAIRDHQGNVVWQKWTTDNPKAAKVLWPLVARTAQARLYVLIPDLLNLATKETVASKLQSQLEPLLVSESETIGAVFARNGEDARALEAFQLALDYDANSTVAQQGVADARKAIADKLAAEKDAGTVAETKPAPAEVDGEFDDDAL